MINISIARTFIFNFYIFIGIAPGAMDSLLSFVTLLSTANMLNYLLVRNNIKKSYGKIQKLFSYYLLQHSSNHFF